MGSKVSVVIPVYNTETTLERCLDSVISQTYQNLEIIIVNDCTPDNAQDVIDRYLGMDRRTRCLRLEKNRGLFHARLAGADIATGDYIAFLDSDDYLGKDAYRAMVAKAEEKKADVVFGNIVIEWAADGRQETHIYNEPDFDIVEGEAVLYRFFEQEGYTFYWYAIWNKLFSKSLFDSARKHFDSLKGHTIMAEDIAYCTVLLALAKRVTQVEYYTNFYLQSTLSSTSRSASHKKYIKNIEDVCRVMDFVRAFIHSDAKYSTVLPMFDRFKEVFILYWVTNIRRAFITPEQKKGCLQYLRKCAGLKKLPNHERKGERDLTYDVDRSFIYSQVAPFNPKFEQLVNLIASPEYKTVAIPFEGVLFHRAYLIEDDFFWLLKNAYHASSERAKEAGWVETRIAAEKLVSQVNASGASLKDIYKEMQTCGISNEECTSLYQAEVELRKRLYTKRESVKQLYDLALYLGKKVVILSEGCLDEESIQDILSRKGYSGYNRIYIESQYPLENTESLIVFKSTDENGEILQRDNQIVEIHYPGPSSAFLKKLSWLERCKNEKVTQLDFFSSIYNRVALAAAANIYCDNPYRPFNHKTDFNKDVYLMGLFPIGLFVMDLAIWLARFAQDNQVTFASEKTQSIERFFWQLLKSKSGDDQSHHNNSCVFAIAPDQNTRQESLGIDRTQKALFAYGYIPERQNQRSLYPFQDVRLSGVMSYLVGELKSSHRIFYSEKLIKNRIEKGIDDFTNRLMPLLSLVPLEAEVDFTTAGYPFEYLLHYANSADIRIFDYASIFKQTSHGEKELSLYQYWKNLYVEERVGRLEGNYYPFLHNKPTWRKALFYLLFDHKTLVEKLKIRFGANTKAFKILKALNRLIFRKYY